MEEPVKEPDFFDLYMDYVGRTEAPIIFHRWACYSMISALLARKVYLSFGHFIIYPNQYVIVVGSPGTRKGVPIGITQKLLKSVGYNKFAADRTSLERFLMDMKSKELEIGRAHV